MINLFLYKFLLVLSLVYVFRYIAELAVKLFLPESEPIKATKTEITFLYVAIAYIITYLIN